MPTRRTLAVIAGWALSRVGFGGQHDEAMLKLRDGCEAAIPFAPESDQVVKVALHALFDCSLTGQHRYDIHTQRCKCCNRSYLEIMGTKPEFMGR
jgi:hypothetical protein